jgi:glycosyltransferase involved in cell wall biosynthesis
MSPNARIPDELETAAGRGRGVKRSNGSLRVAVIAASVDFDSGRMGGAEKQAYYMLRALREAGVDVRIYSLDPHEAHQESVRRMGVELRNFGRLPGVPLRLLILLADLARFRPHVMQSVHAYTNVYSAIAGRALGAISVGGLRSDWNSCLRDNGRISRLLLSWPDAVAVNSHAAIREVTRSRTLDPSRLHLLSNVIDMQSFGEPAAGSGPGGAGECTCICVTRLLPLKRVDVFLRSLAAARAVEPGLRGMVVGSGPEAVKLQELGGRLGIPPEAVRFLGPRGDVADLLRQAEMFVFCSESEGSPNVILEAMTAGLPVITTPAGDAGEMVESAGAGVVVPFGDVNAVANAMVQLARSSALRRELGRAGRHYIAQHCDASHLAKRLLKIYATVARTTSRARGKAFLQCIAQCSETVQQAASCEPTALRCATPVTAMTPRLPGQTRQADCTNGEAVRGYEAPRERRFVAAQK